jgi:hypothetical protein
MGIRQGADQSIALRQWSPKADETKGYGFF